MNMSLVSGEGDTDAYTEGETQGQEQAVLPPPAALPGSRPEVSHFGIESLSGSRNSITYYRKGRRTLTTIHLATDVSDIIRRARQISGHDNVSRDVQYEADHLERYWQTHWLSNIISDETQMTRLFTHADWRYARYRNNTQPLLRMVNAIVVATQVMEQVIMGSDQPNAHFTSIEKSVMEILSHDLLLHCSGEIIGAVSALRSARCSRAEGFVGGFTLTPMTEISDEENLRHALQNYNLTDLDNQVNLIQKDISESKASLWRIRQKLLLLRCEPRGNLNPEIETDRDPDVQGILASEFEIQRELATIGTCEEAGNDLKGRFEAADIALRTACKSMNVSLALVRELGQRNINDAENFKLALANVRERMAARRQTQRDNRQGIPTTSC